MSVVEPEPAGRSLPGRVAAMLFKPNATWELIDAQPTPLRELYKSYVLPLAAVQPVCNLIGVMLFGYGVGGVGVRLSPAAAFLEAVATYALTLAAVLVLAFFIDFLAPNFDGRRDRLRAINLTAYAATAYWLSGVFALLPVVGWLMSILGGLYSLYVLHLGLPKLMLANRDRSLVYFALILVAAVVLGMIRGSMANWAAELGGPLMAG